MKKNKTSDDENKKKCVIFEKKMTIIDKEQ